MKGTLSLYLLEPKQTSERKMFIKLRDIKCQQYIVEQHQGVDWHENITCTKWTIEKNGDK